MTQVLQPGNNPQSGMPVPPQTGGGIPNGTTSTNPTQTMTQVPDKFTKNNGQPDIQKGTPAPDNSTGGAEAKPQKDAQTPDMKQLQEMMVQQGSEKGEKGEKTQKPGPLTNEYIMSLENYLNNSNAGHRLTGVKELLNKFREDKSRGQNQALINLLNKALRDPSQSVKLMAITALKEEYTQGDQLTNKILKDMQKSKTGFGDDATIAGEILLKMSGKKLNVESKANDPQPQTANGSPNTGKNLNVMEK